jgi:ligand-binding sensor domain-containing protein/two-component sensor histidine kinase
MQRILYLQCMKGVRLFLAAAFIFGPGVSFVPSTEAQTENISFEHYSYEDGLSAPVTKIVQDSFGFLWLGGMDGLNRFDGKNFVTFRNNPTDPTSLSNNIINDLCVDPSNRIWAATNGGLCYFDFSDGTFHQVEIDYTLEKIDLHRVHAVTNARDGGIWFATKTILHYWNGMNPVKSFPLPTAPELAVKCLYADQKDRVWIGTNAAVVMLDLKTKKFIRKVITSPFTIEKNLVATVHPIKPLTADTFMLGSWYGGLQKVYLAGDSIFNIPFIDPVESNPRKHVVKGLSRSISGLWWIGTYGNGLSVFDPRTSTFTQHFHHHPADANSLGDEYISDLFTDQSGILWIGTTKGLDKYDPFAQQFSSIPIPTSSGEFSVYRLPSSITEDMHLPGWMWVTVPGAGLFHFNISTHSFDLLQHKPNTPHSLPENTVYTVFYDDQGNMWIGMRGRLCLFDRVSQKFVASPLSVSSVPRGVHTILQDEHKNFWFATHSNGVYWYDPSKQQVIHYTYTPDNPNSLPDNRVFCMAKDEQGNIWIGTQNRGLCKLEPRTGTFHFFVHDKSKQGTIPDNGVYDIYPDLKGKLWIATENGFSVMDLRNNDIRTFTTNDGLCNNDVFSIQPDQMGFLWLATNNGLSRFDPDKSVFKNYYIQDGLPSNTIRGSMYHTRDGTLYFGTTGMLNYFYPDKMKMNKRMPPVIVTHFRIFDREVPVQRNGDRLLPLRLSYRENMITIDFAALNFTNALRNEYAYRLVGFDDKWIYCGNKQTATFTNLDGGHYTFEVKAANNDGVWNEEGTRVTLIIKPPFRKTWWFYLTSILFIAGIIYGIYRFRINQLLKLQHIRTRISRDLHDDIGSTLSSINMISSMAAQTHPEEKKALALFTTISNASSQAMDLMSDIVWSINPKNDRMEMIITRMRQYASEILEAANIAFTLEMDEACNAISLPVEQRKDFYLIFKEAINNLAKYSNATDATIRLQLHHRRLTLVIADNGKGFDAEQQYPGNGLKNMKARAIILKGELSIASIPGKGTTLSLQFPFTP